MYAWKWRPAFVFVCSRRLGSLEFIDNKQDLDYRPITFVVNSRASTQPCLPSNAMVATVTAICPTDAHPNQTKHHRTHRPLLLCHLPAVLENGTTESRKIGVHIMKHGVRLGAVERQMGELRHLARIRTKFTSEIFKVTFNEIFNEI